MAGQHDPIRRLNHADLAPCVEPPAVVERDTDAPTALRAKLRPPVLQPVDAWEPPPALDPVRRQRGKDALDLTAGVCMTRTPKTIGPQEFAAAALARMEEMKITSLVVVDRVAENDQRLLGILHLHDLWGTEMV